MRLIEQAPRAPEFRVRLAEATAPTCRPVFRVRGESRHQIELVRTMAPEFHVHLNDSGLAP